MPGNPYADPNFWVDAEPVRVPPKEPVKPKYPVGPSRPLPAVPISVGPGGPPLAVPSRPLPVPGVGEGKWPGFLPVVGKAAGDVLIQPSLGFGEGIWAIAKAVPQVAGLAAGGLWTGVKDPVLAAKALGNLVIDAYDSLRNVDVSRLTPAARSYVQSAVKAFEENPGRVSGRLIAEALIIVKPLEAARAAKALVKAIPSVGLRGAKGAGVAEVARAAPVVAEAAPAVAPPVRGSFKALVEKTVAEEEALAAKKAAKVVPGRRRKPAVVPAKPAPQVGVPEPVAPSIAPAPVVPAPATVPVVWKPGDRAWAFDHGQEGVVVGVGKGIEGRTRLDLRLDDGMIVTTGGGSASVVPADAMRRAVVKRPVPVAPEAAPPVTPVPVAPVRVAPAAVSGLSVEEALIQRLMATGLSRSEVKFIMKNEPARIQQILVRAAARELKKPVPRAVPLPEVPAGTVQVAPGPLQAAPPVPSVAAPSVAPVPVPGVTAAQVPGKVSIVKPGRVMKVLPGDEAAAEAAMLAEREAEVALLKQKLVARAVAKRAARAQPVPEVPGVAVPVPGAEVAGRALERIPGAGIRMQPGVSSVVESWGYNPETREVAIKLARESQPRVWSSVPQDVIDQFAAAESKGAAFNKLFRGRPEYGLAAPELAAKTLADTVESLLAAGEQNAAVVRAVRARAAELGQDAAEFVARVRAERGIPERAAVAEIAAPVEKVAERAAVEVTPGIAKGFGGGEYVSSSFEGMSEVQRLRWWHSLEEQGNRIWAGTGLKDGLGDALVRVRTIKEQLFAPIKRQLEKAGFLKIKPYGPEDRNLYEAIIGQAAPQTRAVAQTVQVVKQLMTVSRSTGLGDFFRIVRTAIDPAKVRDLSVTDLANLWVKQGVAGDQAIKAARRLKNLVDQGRGTAGFFDKAGFLIPPYEILRPMRYTVPMFVERGGLRAGINDVFGSEHTLKRTIAAIKHPDTNYFLEGLDQFLGHNAPISHVMREWRDIGRLENAISVIVLSPITGAKQLSQVAISAMKLPVSDVVTGLLKMATREGWRGAREKAAFLTEARELQGLLFNTIDDSTRIGYWAEWVSEQVSARVIKGTLIQSIDNYARGVAYWARTSELNGLLRESLKGNAAATRKLLRSGMDLSALNLKREIEMLAKEFADRFNLRSDLLSSPVYLSQPAYQIMRGLNMFAINMTKLAYKELIRPAAGTPVIETIITQARLLGYGTLVGALVNRTEIFLRRREQPKTVAAELAGAWAALGALGIFDRTVTGLVDKTGNLVPLEKAPAIMAKNLQQMGMTLVGGAGPGITFGIPHRLITRPVSVTPIFGPILQGLIDEDAARQQQVSW